MCQEGLRHDGGGGGGGEKLRMRMRMALHFHLYQWSISVLDLAQMSQYYLIEVAVDVMMEEGLMAR